MKYEKQYTGMMTSRKLPFADHQPRRTTDQRRMRQALGSFVTGVTIVTTRSDDGLPVGVTANSFTSVSLDPPLILWSLDKRALSRPIFEIAAAFAVNVLALEQEDLARRFAQASADKFAGLTTTAGFGDVPVIPESAATFECRRHAVHDGGDHVILIGEVMAYAHSDRSPLAFHGGRFRMLTERG